MIGSTLGSYRLDRELGSGGMGRVYAATVVGPLAGLAGGTVVALKIIHPHLLETGGYFRRFLREAEIGRSVRHENVVRTYDCDSVTVDGVQHHFLVMEYVEGQTLRALLGELERVPEELCRHIGREVAKGLSAIHRAGAVHRDLKPENVLITKDRHAVKVMDLGVARMADEAVRLSQSGAFVGSVHYAAPEQFRGPGAEIDGRADLHALGLLLYELATGRHPFAADDFHEVMRRVVDEAPRRPAEIHPQLSPFFEEFVLHLLAKDRAARPTDASAVVRLLDEGERSAWWRTRAKAIRLETRRPLRRVRIQRETSLHGREAELARLRAAWNDVKSGEGRVVLVEGEAGIGKSRLVDEFATQLQHEGEDLHYLFGAYPSGGAATAAGAFSTAYREHFGADGLEEALVPYLRETPVLAPAFAALLRGETTPTGVEPLTKDSLQTCFVHATRALAAERPTLVAIDDLHYAPEEGRALFAAVALGIPGHRVLLVATTRPGLDEHWVAGLDGFAHASHVVLPRLGAKDLARLLVEALRSDHLATDLGLRIAQKSDGNPFYVFEILRGLREGQLIRRRGDGSWESAQVIAEIQIPSSVLELIQARLGDLADEEKDLLELASCAGFEFDPLVVARAAGMDRTEALRRLGRIERTHRLVRAVGRRFVFDHHQVREALHSGLSELLREDYHAAIGEALEAQSEALAAEPSKLPGALCVDLAEHFTAGARGERAARYVGAALTHLEKGHLNDAAVRLLDRVLALPRALEGRARLTAVLGKAHRLELLGRPDAERQALEEGVALSAADGDPALVARARQMLGEHLYRTGRFPEAAAALDAALTTARSCGDREIETAALRSLGVIRWAQGDLDGARARFEDVLDRARQTGDRRAEANGVLSLGAVALARGELDTAQEAFGTALRQMRELGDVRGEAAATGNLGCVLQALERNEEARARFEEHLALARATGDRRGESNATGNLGLASHALGRLSDALAQTERHLALAREVGDRAGEMHASMNLGIVLLSLGRLDASLESLDHAVRLARATGNRRDEALAVGNRGRVLRAAGRIDDARASFDAFLVLARTLGIRAGEALALLETGGALAEAGCVADAIARLDEASAAGRDAGFPHAIVLAAAERASLPGGDADAAARLFREHRVHLDVPSAMDASFRLWRATHDPAHLAEARRLLDDLVRHAPEEDRESMVRNVPLHREIAAATGGTRPPVNGSARF